MQSPIATLRRPDVHLPEIDISSFDPSNLRLPKVDGPTVADIQTAVRDVAADVGLAERRRARWPFVVGTAALVVGASLAVMNADAIRERFERARSWLMERMDSMGSAQPSPEPVAFTAAEPKPIEEPPHEMGSDLSMDDYPEGLGTPTDQSPGKGRTTGAR
jgi:hypothetical protein